MYIFRQLLIFHAREKEKKINKDDIYKNLYTHGIYLYTYNVQSPPLSFYSQANCILKFTECSLGQGYWIEIYSNK
jgi:hypothetical protein